MSLVRINSKCFYSIKIYTLLLFAIQTQISHSQTPLSVEDSINYHLETASKSINRNDNLTASFIGINRALLLSSKIDNDSLEHIVIIKVGQFYNKINDSILSKHYLNKGIKYFTPRNNYDALAVAYRSLGTLAYKKKNNEKAIEYTKRSYALALKSANKHTSLPALYNLAFYAWSKNDIKSCANYALTGINIAKRNKDTTLTANRLKGFYAYTLLKEKQAEKSWELYQPVIKYYKNQKLFRDISGIHKYFIEYYEQYFNKEKLIYHVRQHRENFEKYDKALTSRSISEIREAENFNTIALKFQLSKNELETAKRDNERLVFIISIVCLLLFLLSLSIVLIKRKNSLLKKLKTNAENASVQKSKFIAMISHELRTPLHVVLGFTAFLIEDKPKKSQEKNLNLLNSSANHLLNLTNNVLKLYEFDYKKVKSINQPFEFRKVIAMITDSFYILLEQKNNTLELNITENIPTYLSGDAQKITQILTNLISNANKFTENGKISLTIKQLKLEENLSSLYFCVEDTGVGVAKEHYDSIFEAFNPNTMNIEKTHDGTGLGLSIVKNLLNVMDSAINLESEIGKGSKFSFILKLEVITKINKEVVKINSKTIENLKILVVEDNKINQLLIKKILNKENVIYDLCDNGLIAVNKFKSQPKHYYDLVLMDIHMPIMNGYESSKIIRIADQNIPIIAMTATTLENEENVLKTKDLSGVVYKPFKPSELFNEISKQLTGL